MNAVKSRVGQLSPAQRRLLERQLGLRPSRPAPRPSPTTGSSRGGDVPASAAQRRLWLAQRADTTGTAYNIHGALRLMGALDVEALERALAEIVRRHDSLRTVFIERDGELLQHVRGSVPTDLVQHDCSAIDVAHRDEAVACALGAQARGRFDLQSGPLFRFALINEATDRHVFAVALHHIVADAWSMNVFLGELAALYAAYRAGRPSPLPELPLQYTDLAEPAATEPVSFARSLEYWQRRLASPPPPLELAPGRRARATGTRAGACRKRRLPHAVGVALKELSRRHHVTLFTTMLALLKALLYHYTRQTDILVGATFSNRVRPGTEQLIGFFGNVLVLRTDLSGGLTFEQLLARVRETVVDAFAHGDVPYERIVEELRAAARASADASATTASVVEPRLQVGLEVADADGAAVDFDGLDFEPIEAAVESAKTDLVLLVHDRPNGLLCALEYDAELFAADEIDRMLEQLEDLAAAMTERSGQPFMAVPLFRREVAACLAVAPDAVRRYVPLTKTQADLYIGHLIEADAGTHTPSCLGLLGTGVDLARWRRAFDAVIAGEEMAHVRLANVRGHIFQAIGPDVTFGYQVIELPDRAELVARAEQARLEPIDVDHGPIARMTVFTGSWGSAALVAVNHMFMDAFSLVMLFRTIARAYDALAEGRDTPEPRNVFLDDVENDLGRGDSAAVQRFWTDRLRGVAPLDRAALGEGDPRPIIIYRDVDGELLSALKTLAKATGYSAPTVLLGVYAALLGRVYAADAPFVVHTILARRTSRSRRSLGCFVGNLPYVFPERLLSDDATLDDWIVFAAGYRGELGAMDSVPASAVGRILGSEGTKFCFNYLPSAMLEVGGEARVMYDLFSYRSSEVHLMARQEDEGLELKLCQDARRPGGREFLERLARVVHQAAAGTRRVSDLDLLLPDEHADACPAAGAEELTAAARESFGELFAARAAAAPTAIAASCGGVQLTYGQLKRRSGRLAAALAARGVGAETVVALLGERSLDFLVAVLAVLEAGAAYLPLDPRNPEARWRHAIVEAGCSLVLADAVSAHRLAPGLAGIADAERPRILPLGLRGHRHATPIDRCAFPENIAYVIYTSGSTGAPKGAMLERRGLDNHLRIKIDELALTGADAVAQTASQSFDISVWQFLAPLASGGRVEIVPDAIAFDPTRLLDATDRAGVTVLETVPSLLRAALDHAASLDNPPELVRLRLLLLTGEALPPDLCRAWLERYPRIPIVNAYGPTECSDDVTHHTIASAPAMQETRVPIGHGLANTRLYVLDRALRAVPPGTWGELYVGGVGVGRGYVTAPRQTAAAFVPDPFGGARGGRLYRTGDQVRRRADGAFEFLGRLDHQVKIRGHRIELDEIAAVLARQRGVKDAVVVARRASDGDTFLAAYIVPAPGAPAAVADLRDTLKKTLPDYMVPPALTLVDAIPLTPNGKLDRRALPEPERDAAARATVVAPRDLLERQLVDVWEELLTARPIGVTDGFFDLGGHSLLAVRMLGRIKERFGRELPLTTFFEGQTIEALADTLRREIDTLPPSPLVALQPRGGRPPLFCVHPGSGHVLGFYHLARRLGPLRPVYGLQDPALYGEWGFDVPIERMAARYLAEIRAVQPNGPYHLCGWSYGGQIAFEMARQLAAGGGDVALLAVLDTGAPEGVGEFNDRSDAAALLSIVVEEWGLQLSATEIRALSPETRLDALAARLRDEQGLAFADAAWLALRAERFRARLRTLEQYAPGPYDGPMLLLRAEQTGVDDDVAADYPDDPTMGWRRFAVGGVAVHVVPGSHSTMLTEPHVAALVERLDAHLAGVSRKEDV